MDPVVVCVCRCVYVADMIIGPRAKAVRDKFNEFVQEAATQVQPDVHSVHAVVNADKYKYNRELSHKTHFM